MEDIAIWAGSPNGMITYVCDAATKLGFSREEVLAQKLPMTFPLGGSDWATILFKEKAKRKPLLTTRIWSVKAQRQDGSMIPLEIIGLFLRDGQGKLVKIIGVARPIMLCRGWNLLCKKSQQAIHSLFNALLERVS